MNELQSLALSFRADDRDIVVKHTEGPEGVRGRNSDNARVRETLGWEPKTPLKDGLRVTYDWIAEQVDADRKAGIDISTYCASKVVTQTTESLDKLAVGGAAAPAVAAVAVEEVADRTKPLDAPAAAAGSVTD
jgi:hypothetical protein